MMNVLADIKWKYLMHRTYFRASKGSCKIGRNVRIKNSRIFISPGATLVIGDNVNIENAMIYVGKGCCFIDSYSIIGGERGTTLFIVDNGDVHIGHHSKVSLKRIWVRFGGRVAIGNYTNINAGSEVRCDESVVIGDYNQISYDVNIWDTNTHSILPVAERRKMTEDYYPYFGKELSRPKTKPIVIGDDCWIGQKASILKGCGIGNEVIVGYNCLLAGTAVPDRHTVVSDVSLKIIKR